MAIVWRITGSIVVLASLWTVRRLFKRQLLPPPPWRIPTAAVLLTCVQEGILAAIPQAATSPLGLSVNVLSSFAWLVLITWATLELPPCWGVGRPVPRIIRDLINLTLAALLTGITLHQNKINLVGLLTTSAVLTAVLGLAAQETLKDLLGGLSMQISSPYHEGDWIEIEGVGGTVHSITLMNTELISIDGSHLIIPNSKAVEALIRRLRPRDPIGNVFSIGLDYNHPPAKAIALILEILQQHSAVLKSPPPKVWVDRFAESSIEYKILVFQEETSEASRAELRGQILQHLWYALQRDGRKIPFPVVELRQHEPAEADEREPLPDADARAQLLASNPLFIHLSEKEQYALAEMTRCLYFAPGETVVKEGEMGDCLYQVISGSLEVLKFSPGSQNQDLRVAILEPNSVFGEMTLCTDAPRHATVRTISESLLLEVERRDLVPLLENNPALLEQLGQLVSSRQAKLEELNEASAPVFTSRLINKMRSLFSSQSKR
ncbi:mechanosensitive ion channel family protein [Cyanobium sp. FACHB-13342]|uniref:mechanosensitive ion channel family protein n=1 Tax=Cyanobium sp. FACHB-13342 TaxID=2692793 RepID=UPI00168020F1|nr:mechanosensitive ion channel family protein [Cyanobium sp. FACHB-13342]MBD2424043.1 mechanosensitive ion channel family protein [Cyanobium sp. FACHB-13342]